MEIPEIECPDLKTFKLHLDVSRIQLHCYSFASQSDSSEKEATLLGAPLLHAVKCTLKSVWSLPPLTQRTSNTVVARVVKNKIHKSGKFRYYCSTLSLCSKITSPSNYPGISSAPSHPHVLLSYEAPLPSSDQYFPRGLVSKYYCMSGGPNLGNNRHLRS